MFIYMLCNMYNLFINVIKKINNYFVYFYINNFIIIYYNKISNTKQNINNNKKIQSTAETTIKGYVAIRIVSTLTPYLFICCCILSIIIAVKRRKKIIIYNNLYEM